MSTQDDPQPTTTPLEEDTMEIDRTADPAPTRDDTPTQVVDTGADDDGTWPTERLELPGRDEPPTTAAPAAAPVGATALATGTVAGSAVATQGSEPHGAPYPPDEGPRGVRVGTVVWGLVVAAVGVGLMAFASGLVFDVELALIVLVAAAGVALLVGTLLSSRRRRG